MSAIKQRVEIGDILMLQGDCLEIIPELIKEGVIVHSVVCDPPYELNFMGKSWDSTGIAFNPETWKLCNDILLAGGHLLAFGGTRTHHSIACAIEDAGFDIRDMVNWMYGSGFPKALDVSKAIDKKLGSKREKKRHKARPKTSGTMSGKEDSRPWIEESRKKGYHEVDDDSPVSEQAKKWEGWKSALKPSFEPCTLARKPLSEKTIAENILKHGTGSLNIDGCRVEGEMWSDKGRSRKDTPLYGKANSHINPPSEKGRFPANTIHDGSDEVEEVFARYSEKHGESPARFFYSGKVSQEERNEGLAGVKEANKRPVGMAFGNDTSVFVEKEGGTCKFRQDGSLDGVIPTRKNHHPTVKPIALMAYLQRLVTPVGGVVLDPFMGSGTGGISAHNEGFKYIGIELDPEYFKIAVARVEANARQGRLDI